MYTSDVLQQLDQLNQLAELAQTQAQTSPSGVWDGLLSLIGDLIKKILNAKIGSDGKSIKDMIDGLKSGIDKTIGGIGHTIVDVKDKIIEKVGNVVTDITTAVNGVTSTIGSKISGAVTDIGDKVNGVALDIKGKVDDAIGVIGGKVSGAVTAITGKIDDTLGGIGGAIRDAIDKLIGKLGDVIDSIKGIAVSIGNSIGEAIHAIAGQIGSAINEAIAAASSFVSDALDAIGSSIAGIAQSIKDTIAGFIDTARGWISDAIAFVGDKISQVIQSLKDTYESVKGTVIDWLTKLLIFLQSALTGLHDFVYGAIDRVKAWWAEEKPKIEKSFQDYNKQFFADVQPAIDALMHGDYTKVLGLVDKAFQQYGLPGPVGIVKDIATVIAWFWETIRLQFVPAEVAASKRANIALGLDPIGLDTASQAVYKGLWSKSAFINNAALGGVASSRASIALEANRPIPSPGQAQQLFLRGEINEKQHDEILSSYGFSQGHINEIKSLYAIIPGVADIITMAVREAFTPDIAEKFGQFEDLPEAFVTWAGKQGLTEEWASRYWAAHWQLPSPQMGFGMYQRRIIDEDDLKLLLRALDVMPYWREKLIQLAYNPLTRVDVRRMYKVGVLDEEGVYNAYLDDGYSPERARQLTEFTKIYSPPEDQTEQDTFKALARSTYSQAYKKNIISRDEYKSFLMNLGYAGQDAELLISIDDYAIAGQGKLFDLDSYKKDNQKLILNAYDRGLLTRDDTFSMLLDLGYEEGEAELELSLIDYNRQLSLRNALVKQLHDQYVSFIIDTPQLNEILNSFNFAVDEITKLQQEWDIERSFRTRKPTLAQTIGFFKDGLLSLEQLIDEIRGLGYPDKYVNLYVQQLSIGG